MGCSIQKQRKTKVNTLKLENENYLIQKRKLYSIYGHIITLQDISQSSLLQRRAKQEIFQSLPTGQTIFCSNVQLSKN